MKELKCHYYGTPCYRDGVYEVLYNCFNNHGTTPKEHDPVAQTVYGSCEDHIEKMRQGFGELVYVSDTRYA